MLTEKENTRISKFLSLVLRHNPQAADITLDENGWADLPLLITRMNEKGFRVTLADLVEVVDTNAKKRFALNAAQDKIRANQGHSIEVDVELTVAVPPAVLYHGTATRFVESILAQGIVKMDRRHVHLSRDLETAIKVGQRHGKVQVLRVDAEAMHRDGFTFFLSENHVWLTDHVPVAYIQA